MYVTSFNVSTFISKQRRKKRSKAYPYGSGHEGVSENLKLLSNNKL